MNPVSRTARTVAVLVAAAAAVVPATGAFAADAKPAARPAVLAPLLDTFQFGADVGLPLGCTLVLGYVRDGADLFGQAATVGVFTDAAATGCQTAADQGLALIANGRTQAAPLAAINTYANPAIGQGANSARTVGTDYATLISPFGKTVAGFGDTLDFFQGGPR
ncbi:MAG: hypothetical protein JWM64_1173 [Frankiales bacterium]|nr:hypothetical protein [Frankiales bacterium]